MRLTFALLTTPRQPWQSSIVAPFYRGDDTTSTTHHPSPTTLITGDLGKHSLPRVHLELLSARGVRVDSRYIAAWTVSIWPFDISDGHHFSPCDGTILLASIFNSGRASNHQHPTLPCNTLNLRNCVWSLSVAKRVPDSLDPLRSLDRSIHIVSEPDLVTCRSLGSLTAANLFPGVNRWLHTGADSIHTCPLYSTLTHGGDGRNNQKVRLNYAQSVRTPM